MTKNLSMACAAISSMSAASTICDAFGDTMYGSKHGCTTTPKHIKKDVNRAKAKAAKKARQKQRNK